MDLSKKLRLVVANKSLKRCPRSPSPPSLPQQTAHKGCTSLILAIVDHLPWREPPNNLIPKADQKTQQHKEYVAKGISELEAELNRVSWAREVVLRHVELDLGLTLVKHANDLRTSWNSLCSSQSSSTPSAIQSLLNDSRKHPIDDFLVLPLKEICSNCHSNENTNKTIGVYVPNGGKPWGQVLPSDSPLGRKELDLIQQTITALLILHMLGIPHQNLSKFTILIDYDQRQPRTAHIRLTDWKQMPPKSPSTADQQQHLLAKDWKALAAVFAHTWLDNLALHPPACAKLFTQVINLLGGESSDQHALLAWTLLSNQR